MAKTETWVEVEAYSNSSSLARYPEQNLAKGSQRFTEKLVEGRWLVRWWRRVR
jgi:hypothetical protein